MAHWLPKGNENVLRGLQNCKMERDVLSSTEVPWRNNV